MLRKILAALTLASVAATAAAQSAPPLKKFRVLLPFKDGITFFPISTANQLGYLKGKNIGTIDLTRGDLPLLRAQLQHAGLVPSRDVTFVALGPTMSVHPIA